MLFLLPKSLSLIPTMQKFLFNILKQSSTGTSFKIKTNPHRINYPVVNASIAVCTAITSKLLAFISFPTHWRKNSVLLFFMNSRGAYVICSFSTLRKETMNKINKSHCKQGCIQSFNKATYLLVMLTRLSRLIFFLRIGFLKLVSTTMKPICPTILKVHGVVLEPTNLSQSSH